MDEQLSYNVDTNSNDVYDRVAEDILSRPQIFKMAEHEPVNDIDCRHETLIPDPDDTIGDAVFHGCANPQCGVGFYIKNKNIT